MDFVPFAIIALSGTSLRNQVPFKHKVINWNPNYLSIWCWRWEEWKRKWLETSYKLEKKETAC